DRRQGRAGGNRLDTAHAVDPGLRHLQGREKPEKRAALRRLRDAGGGAGRDAEGVELRSDQYQGVRYADRGPEGEPAGQPGEHEAVLHPGRELVERQPGQGQRDVVELDSDLAARGAPAAVDELAAPAPVVAARGAIELRGLTKRYGEDTVVDAIALSIAPAEFFSLLGPSGS